MTVLDPSKRELPQCRCRRIDKELAGRLCLPTWLRGRFAFPEELPFEIRVEIWRLEPRTDPQRPLWNWGREGVQGGDASLGLAHSSPCLGEHPVVAVSAWCLLAFFLQCKVTGTAILGVQNP